MASSAYFGDFDAVVLSDQFVFSIGVVFVLLGLGALVQMRTRQDKHTDEQLLASDEQKADEEAVDEEAVDDEAVDDEAGDDEAGDEEADGGAISTKSRQQGVCAQAARQI